MTSRRLGLPGATAIGVGSMLGAGVFVVWGPAAAAAGSLLPVAVALAALVAALNAGSTAQLAAVHPVAGGAYAYGRAELGAWPGFLAGLGFVTGKTASVAAIGLAIGTYVLPGRAALVATVAIVASWALNSRGITRTGGASVVIAAAVVGVLVLAIVAIAAAPAAPDAGVAGSSPAGVPAAAALLFFAFAGYARIATLGEEVSAPERTIPRAIGVALGAVLALYITLAVVLPRALGDGLAGSSSPVADAVEGTWLAPAAVTVAAAVAASGSLLALTAGVGRTAMAMAREGDLPRVLARQNARGVPALAEGVAAAAAITCAWAGSLTLAIAMSAFAVLLYYAVADAAAFRAAGAGHLAGWRMPRPLSALGAVLCMLLVAFLPAAATVAGLAVLAAGSAVRALVRRSG